MPAQPDRAARRSAQRATDRAQLREAHRRAVERRERRRRRRSIIWRVVKRVGTVVVVVVVVFGAVFEGDRVFRNLTKPAAGTLPPIGAVTSYSITYQEKFPGVTRIEQDSVQRPFDSLSYTRSITDNSIVTGDMNNTQGGWIYGTSGWTLLDPGQERAANDPQPALAIARGLRMGLARVTGTKTILGRTCTMVRVGAPVGDPMTKPTGRNHVDVCLDSTGVMLSYDWTLDGKFAQSKVATSFVPNAALPAATFTPTPVAPSSADNSTGVTAAPLTAADQAQLDPTVVAPPGVTFDTGLVRYDGLSEPPEVTTSLLYLSGPSSLVSIDYTSGSSDTTGTKVKLAGGHVGYLQLDLDETTFVTTDGSSSVDISGTDPALVLQFGKLLKFAPPPSTATTTTVVPASGVTGAPSGVTGAPSGVTGAVPTSGVTGAPVVTTTVAPPVSG